MYLYNIFNIKIIIQVDLLTFAFLWITFNNVVADNTFYFTYVQIA